MSGFNPLNLLGITPAPDFKGAAEAQSVGSRPNINTPWGSQTWSVGPDGRPVSSFSLGGTGNETLQGLQSQMLRAANYDPTKARDEAIKSNYDQAKSRLDPEWQQRMQAFRSSAANQGIDPGTQAYNTQFSNETGAMNDAYSTAMANAIRQGNETQQVQMNQMNQPFNQYGSLIGSSLQQPSNIGNAPNYLGAAGMQYGAGKDMTSAIQAQQQGLKGGGSSLMSGKGGAGAAPAAPGVLPIIP